MIHRTDNHDSSTDHSQAPPSTLPPIALIFDTETTDLIKFKKPFSDPSQPDLVQLGMILVDTVHWKKRLEVSMLINFNNKGGDDGAVNAGNTTTTTTSASTISPSAQKIHGISNADCENVGVPLPTAIRLFQDAMDVADCLVAHNINFDWKVLQTAFHRVGYFQNNQQPPLLLDKIPQICTMKSCTDILQLQGRYGNSYKWPSLEESHRHFTGSTKGMEDAHDALVDAQACLTVFRGLLESGAIDPIEKRDKEDVAFQQQPQQVDDESPVFGTAVVETIPELYNIAVAETVAVTPPRSTTTTTAIGSIGSTAIVTEVAQPGELVLVMHDTGFAVKGNTYKYKESLKSLGATWSAPQRAWVFECHSMLGPARKLAAIPPPPVATDTV
jgi:DNA polymerase III epsilon subunit-like protein